MWSSSWIFPLLCLLCFPFLFNEFSLFYEWTIFFNEVELSISFLVDSFSLIFFFTVSLVSVSVIFYSLSYMQTDNFKKKFIISLLIFVISMILLIFSSSLFWVMVGWDGLGLTSFYLILFFQNWKSFNSAMVTFLTNRIGDGFFLLVLSWSIHLSQWDYWSIPLFGKLFLLLGAFSKSAQCPFSAWLPLAMAAPTPVSSLVHSSTLVTAGVFLLIRFKGTFDEINLVISILSFLTILLAGLSSAGEMDLKKIIALSTLSHIGLMVLSISMGMFMGAFIHLLLHAFFKSLLFMVSGVIIHFNISNQDVRKISLSGVSFSVSCPLFVSLFSMIGAPFLSGFVSKEILYSQFSVSGFPVLFFFLSVFFTSMYSFRLLCYLLGNSCVSLQSENIWQESWIFFIMTIFSICGGILVNSVSTFLESSQMSSTIQPILFSEAKMMLFLVLAFGGIVGLFFVSIISHSKLSFPFHEMLFILFFSLLLQKSVLSLSWVTMFKVFTKGTMDAFIVVLTSNLSKTVKISFQLSNTLLVFEELSVVFFTFAFMVWSWNVLFRME